MEPKTEQAIPEEWSLFAANSVGYIVLVAAIVLAFGVFSGVVFLWSELVSFISGVCFSYPSLRRQLASTHPALLRLLRSNASASSGQSSSGSHGSDADVAQVFVDGASDASETTTTCVRPKLSTVSESPEAQPSRATSSVVPVTPTAIVPRRRSPTHLNPHSAVPASSVGPTSALVHAHRCFFCHGSDVRLHLPACGAWNHFSAWQEGLRNGEKPWEPEELPSTAHMTPCTAGEGTGVADACEANASTTDSDGAIVGGDGFGGVTPHAAYLPQAVESVDFATGTVLSVGVTPRLPVMQEDPSPGPQRSRTGSRQRSVESHDQQHPGLCTPYALLHKQRADLTSQVGVGLGCGVVWRSLAIEHEPHHRAHTVS